MRALLAGASSGLNLTCMDTNLVLEVIGWIGSLLVVWSLMVARVLRFRWMNMAGAAIATVYNAIIEVWPFAFMNLAITLIDIYWLWRLYREAKVAGTYLVLPVTADDAFVKEVMRIHADDIAAHAPAFTATSDPARSMFLLTRGDEAVGLVAVHDRGDGLGRVELDWVKKRFRDFSPGEFVYRESQVLADAGFERLEVVPHEGTDTAYLARVGYSLAGDRWVRDVAG